MSHEIKGPVVLVDPPTASRKLCVSPRKLWAMTFEERPGIPYVRLGRLVRYRVVDLERWIEERVAKKGDR